MIPKVFFRRVLALIALSLWAGSAGAAEAQEAVDEASSRPRIGLVLSGGGALGSAHVGVIQVLEELRVPVDFVAGTSMGAVIGGLYASGASPEELEELLATTDWRDLLDDRPPRRRLPYRRKVDDQTFLIRFELGLNDFKFQLPTALVSGQKLAITLQEMLLRVSGTQDFDQLPIPFRAVATDLETGEAVILQRGDLALAIRASASVPGVFAPIVIDDRVLVDGGAVLNLPVEVALEMGADVIIAVDVGEPLAQRQELESLTQVLGQMASLQSRLKSKEQSALAQVVIRPDLEGFNSSQFDRGPEMVPLGLAAAREAIPQLQAYSLSEAEFEERRARLRRDVAQPEKLAAVQLTLDPGVDPELARRQLRIRPGDPFDMNAIREDLDRLYETGDYERIDASLFRLEDGVGVEIQGHEKPWGPNIFRFGASLSANLDGESSFGLLTSFTMTGLNRYRGEFKTIAEVGENPRVSGEFYQPLTLSQTWFAAARLSRERGTTYAPLGGGLFAKYRRDLVEAELDLGYQLGRFGELRLGLVRGVGRTRLQGDGDLGPVPEVPEEVDFDLGGIRFAAVIDQFDNVNFPRHGLLLALTYFDSRQGLGADSDFQIASGFLGGAVSHGRHTLLGLSNFTSALDSDSPEVMTLGRLFALSGYRPEEVAGRYGGSAALLYLFQVSQLPTAVGNGIYLGASLEAGNLWDDSSQVDLGDLKYSASVSLGLDTLFGPVYLAQAFNEDGRGTTYLYLGRTF